MVAGLIRSPAARLAVIAMALAGLAGVAPRAALFVALLLSVIWIGRLDNETGTWGVLYVLLLMVLGVLTLLVAGLALIHRLASG